MANLGGPFVRGWRGLKRGGRLLRGNARRIGVHLNNIWATITTRTSSLSAPGEIALRAVSGQLALCLL